MEPHDGPPTTKSYMTPEGKIKVQNVSMEEAEAEELTRSTDNYLRALLRVNVFVAHAPKVAIPLAKLLWGRSMYRPICMYLALQSCTDEPC